MRCSKRTGFADTVQHAVWCSVNLVVFGCGAVQHADKVCGHRAACTCIFCYPHHLYSKLLGLLRFWWEEQNSESPKTFFGGYLLVFVEYLCNRNPKIKTKNIKNYSSILTIVNHWNWLHNLLPLNYTLMARATPLNSIQPVLNQSVWQLFTT